MSQTYNYEPNFFHYRKAFSSNMPNAHFHQTYEIYYLISGKRRYVIEDKIYDLSPGDMILIPDMKTHKVMNPPDTSSDELHERYLLTPKKEDIPPILLSCFDTHFYHLSPEAKEIVEALFCQLEKHTLEKDAFGKLYMRSIMSAILCVLTNLPTSAKQQTPLGNTDCAIQDATTYIKNNCAEPITLGEIASKYSYTKEYFSLLFKKSTGFGFNEYLNQVRITNAITLLTTTSMSVTEISTQCGFNNPNYFSEVFRKITKKTPKVFRAENKREV